MSDPQAHAGSSDIPMDKKELLKKVGILFANFILVYFLFRFLITLSERLQMIWIYYVTVIIYALGITGLFIAFFILNGFGFSRAERTREELPEKWTEERKDDFMAKQPERKKKARFLVLFILPLILTFFVSYIELHFLI